MKYAGIIVCLFLLALLITPAFAGDLDPIINKDIPVFIETPLPVLVDVIYTEKVTTTRTIVDVFFEFLGWEQEITDVVKNEISVEIGGATVATIPNNSKFVDMEIHEYCIRYQYGTSRWYSCEQERISV